jgi:hypothetical protein
MMSSMILVSTTKEASLRHQSRAISLVEPAEIRDCGGSGEGLPAMEFKNLDSNEWNGAKQRCVKVSTFAVAASGRARGLGQ